MGNVLSNDKLEEVACETKRRVRIYDLIKGFGGHTSDQLSLKTGIDKTQVQEILCQLKDEGFIKTCVSNGMVCYFIDLNERPFDDYEHKSVPRRKHDFIEFLSISEFSKLVTEVTGVEFELKTIKSLKRYRNKFETVVKRLPFAVSMIKTEVCNNKNLRLEPSSVLIIIKDSKVFGYNLGSLLEKIK